MFSISEVSQKTGLSPRALRYYEKLGLICCTRDHRNGYRRYCKSELSKLEKIQRFKSMEFSLEQIKSFMDLDQLDIESKLITKFQEKIADLEVEIKRLNACKDEVQNQLLVTQKFLRGEDLECDQRRVLMQAMREEILKDLKVKKEVGETEIKHLEREEYLMNSEEKQKFLQGVKECVQFAKKEGIRLGPTRGSSPALLSLYALGWSDFDPSGYNLIPERFSATDFDLQIDVEFKKGKKFIDFCKSVSHSLPMGKIEAFKLPILDIIYNVEKKLGKTIDFNSIDRNDPLILDQFRKGEIEYIFSFDFPVETLMAKYCDDQYYHEGIATKMMSEYLKSQKIIDFKDLLNIEAIFRPNLLNTKPFMREYIDRYPKAKEQGFSYDCLSDSLNEYLAANFGVIIYQEDIIQIIHEYTNWDYQKCNQFRRALGFSKVSKSQKEELLKHTGQDVYALLEKESPVVFCKAHSVGAWPELIKKTAILKGLHRELYLTEIKKWEEENGYSWADFGFISGGLSLMQQ